MASSNGLALPEVPQDGDAKSWFKMFEVCVVANEWDNGKKQAFTNISEWKSMGHF